MRQPTPGQAATPLARKLVRQIAATGPISVAEFMAACLGDPEFGYYMIREPFGQGGDFVTSPEISQVFGELIGLWGVAVWEAMGAPSRFVLAELGPGRGTLMADALRAAKVRPDFLRAATIAVVETSPRLRAAQREALGSSGTEAQWFDRVDDLPAAPLIVVANEFFDALPIRQLVRTESGWAERMVGLGDTGRLAFGLRPIADPGSAPADPPLARPTADRKGSTFAEDRHGRATSRPSTPSLAPWMPGTRPGVTETAGTGGTSPIETPLGAILELRPAAEAIVTMLAEPMAREGGAALIIDYGHTEPGFGDTLQALYRHLYDDPLAHPGKADLTAHVDFTALAAAAKASAMVRPPINQAEFLGRLGIAERVRQLAAGKPMEEQQAIGVAAHRLVHPEAMGSLFKVLAFSSRGLALPGFDP